MLYLLMFIIIVRIDYLLSHLVNRYTGWQLQSPLCQMLYSCYLLVLPLFYTSFIIVLLILFHVKELVFNVVYFYINRYIYYINFYHHSIVEY